MELPEQDEDFGQTLGYWGVNTGPYLVLPFMGPSTVRDSAGMGVDYFNPDGWDLIESPENYYAIGLYVVDLRAFLLSYEDQITGDRYDFIRNTYLQRRNYLVNDGVVENDPFAEQDEDLMLDEF
jgi:Surface lipoprotein